MAEEASIHQQFVEAAFQVVLEAVDALSAAKSKRDKLLYEVDREVLSASKSVEDAMNNIESLMKESGEYEILLPGENGIDYKINYSTPRQSVKIVDPNAVPDLFCKIERKPKLKEIGDLLKAGGSHNWASLEYGEKKLQWKAVKHQNKEQDNGD